MTHFRMHVNEELKYVSAHSTVREIFTWIWKYMDVAILLYCEMIAHSYGKIKLVERPFCNF